MNIEEIRAREQAATPGPWYVHESHNWHKDPPKEYFMITRSAKKIIASWIEQADAQFISAARQDIPDLLSEIERLTTELEQKNRELSQLAIESIEREKQSAKFEAEVQHWADAEKDGRLVVLPCKIGGSVFTVDEVFFPCQTCKEMGRKELDACYRDNTTAPYTGAAYECPEVYEIKEHTVQGYTVSANGVSLAGEWGYEGLETFMGYNGKQYLTPERAEAALSALEVE